MITELSKDDRQSNVAYFIGGYGVNNIEILIWKGVTQLKEPAIGDPKEVVIIEGHEPSGQNKYIVEITAGRKLVENQLTETEEQAWDWAEKEAEKYDKDMITDKDLEEGMYAILNTERDRFLTSASGRGIWYTEEKAQEVLDAEFGGGSHLEVVKVTNYEQ